MTARTWISSAVMALILSAGWMVAVRVGWSPPLRSAHSEPATGAPPPMVVVTAAGKTFHQVGCAALHGPAQMESGAEAIADGYMPCPRCLPR
jgi:hypothetical protein